MLWGWFAAAAIVGVILWRQWPMLAEWIAPTVTEPDPEPWPEWDTVRVVDLAEYREKRRDRRTG